ncbi:MAG: diaminopimelate epimerase [Bacteroidetes bacterium]|nr:diaminopimelate epimerase [Bacteroidota bacterium]
MRITFYKYQGTGNDFVMIDNRDLSFNKKDTKLIAGICDRKFGIGADGLILLENDKVADFCMVYFNADGRQSSMCGNGGRCLVRFAHKLGIISNKATFSAIDGLHEAYINDETVSLKMQDVSDIKKCNTYIYLDTGSPHHVSFVEGLEHYDVFGNGKKIRYGAPYGECGTNVNFVEQKGSNVFAVRTYERGVENETLSCGTGVTAVALAAHASGKTQKNEIILDTPGGQLSVHFEPKGDCYEHIYLKGPAKFVFKGEYDTDTSK